jgi:perosamine synthetase
MSKSKRYWHEVIGYNYRMTNLQAALGYAQLLRINELLGRRQSIYRSYLDHLGHVEGISLNRAYPWASPTYWLVCLELLGPLSERRESLMQELKQLNIDSRPYFYPMSEMPYIAATVNTPVTNQKSKEGINLPTYFDLSSSEIEYISSCILSLL